MKRSFGVLIIIFVLAALVAPSAGAQPKGSGKRFLYASDEFLRISNVDGTNDHEVGVDLEPVAGSVISPNGKKIAISRLLDPHQIWVANIDGSNAHPVTSGPEDALWPTWNKDGSKVGFTRYDPPSGQRQFFTVKPNGDGVKRITKNNQYGVYEAMFSPTSNTVVYARKDASNNYDLCLMGGDGTFLKCPSHGDGFEGPGDWSPRGKKIVYTKVVSAQTYLWIMNADGSHKHQIPNVPADVGFAYWPAGGFIVFDFSDGGDSEIGKIHPNGSGFLQMTNNAVDDRIADVSA